MQPKKWFLRQFIRFIATAIVGLTIGGILFLINNRFNVNFFQSLSPTTLPPTTTTTYHPSTSTIETYLEKGEFLNAYNEALKYSEERLNDSTSYKYLGLSLFQMNKYNESTQNFELALQDEALATSTKAEIYYFIGRNYDQLGDYDNSISYFQKSIQLNPNYSLPYNALGVISVGKGNYKEAISLFEKGLSFIPDSENNPLSSWSYYYLAKAYFEINNYPKALQMINKADQLVTDLTKPVPTLFIQYIKELKKQIEQALNQ